MATGLRILALCTHQSFGDRLTGAARGGSCQVVLATSADEGLRRAARDTPDASVVCVDLPLAERLSLVRSLRQACPDQAIVAIGGTATDAFALEALRAGVDDVVDAAVPAGELIRRVKTLCSLKRGGAAALRSAEARLRAAEARYRTLVERALHGIVILQADRLAYINPAGAAMCGYSPSDLVGRPIEELMGVAQVEEAWEIYRRLGGERGEAQGEIVITTAEGEPLPLAYSALATDLDGEPAILLMFADMRERVAREENALRQARELEVMYALAHDLGSLLDPEQVVAVGCERIAEVAGLDACAIYLVEPEGEALRLAGRPSLAEGVPPMREELTGIGEFPQQPIVANQDRDGTDAIGGAGGSCAEAHAGLGLGARMLVPLKARDALIGILKAARRPGSPLTAKDVQLVATAATSVGLAIENARLYATLKESYSRIVDTQAELVRAERLAALGELSATVAHEVRNPLAAIYNSLSQLGRLVPEEGDARTLLDIAQEEASRLNRIIGDLLLFAKPGEPDLRPTPIDDVIDAAARAARQDAAARDEVELVVRPVPADLLALCDGSQMRQALVNLIVNAFQAIEGTGRVVLDAATVPEDDSVEITVEDDGAGMGPELVERAFDPFYTTRPAGSGLGLAIVRRIVDDHHGTVKIATIPGEFTRFHLRLPRAEGA